MPRIESDTPKALKPFLSLGLDLTDKGGQWQGDCPYCGKEGHWFVNTETSQWDCKSCAAKGNSSSFLEQFLERSLGITDDSDYEELARDRGLLRWETLAEWNLCRSFLTREWLIPAYSASGKLCNLYRYAPVRDKEGNYRYRVQSLGGLNAGLFGPPGFLTEIKEASHVLLCEGCWDGMAAWESLGNGGGVGSSESSYAVVATPGASTFLESWASLFADKVVYVLYDNDHGRTNSATGTISYAAFEGVKRVASVLAQSRHAPAQVARLCWAGDPGKECEEDFPDGYDVRDYLSPYDDLDERKEKLESLLGAFLHPVTEDQLGSGTAYRSDDPEYCEECESWEEVVEAWRNSGLKWIDGLEQALSVMLACIISTEGVGAGSQLWARVLGPPSCLDGDTPIFDPVDGSTVTVRERCVKGVPFHVYTRTEAGEIVVGRAFQPKEFPAESIYEVSFKSGRRIRCTAGHRFWNGSEYVAVHTIADALRSSDAYPLPSISGTGLEVLRRDVRRSSRTTEGSRCGCRVCSCSCGGRLPTAEDTGRGVPPSPADVRGRNPSQSHEDGLSEERTHTRHLFVHHSNSDVSPFEGLLRNVIESQSPVLPEITGRTSLPSQDVSRIPVSNNRRGITRQEKQLVLRSIPVERQFSLLEEYGSHYIVQSPRCQRPVFASSLLGRGSSPCRSLLGLEVFFSAAAHVRRPTGDTSELWECRPSSTIQSRRESCLKGTDQLLADGDQETNWTYHTPIRQKTADLTTLSEVDEVVKVEYVRDAAYYDFHVPLTNNYWACGVFNHNCGKTTLCEAVALNKGFVKSVSVFTGFHSGVRGDDGKDVSLIATLKNKTLVIKDGDTLMKHPNKDQILAEMRDLYDRVSRTHYRTGTAGDYEGVNLTIILCGTAGLQKMDTAELGERYVTITIMDEIDDGMEYEICRQALRRVRESKGLSANGKVDSQDTPAMTKARKLTGGYVGYLRRNADRLMDAVVITDEDDDYIVRLAVFSAHMRARPSKTQDETAERELGARLSVQFGRLALCLTAVLGKQRVDADVLRIVRKCALDTSRGRVMRLCAVLRTHQEDGGIECKRLSHILHEKEDYTRTLLGFLYGLGITHAPRDEDDYGIRQGGNPLWRLTPKGNLLWESVVETVL